MVRYVYASPGLPEQVQLVFQDNQISMRMKVNGINSCTGNLRNIDFRYFFIKYRAEKDEISIVYCPAHLILDDYFTKSL